MEPSNNQVEAKVLLELTNVPLHRLILNEKNQFSFGTLRLCELEKPNKQKVHFLNMNSFYYTLTRETIFVRVPYKKNVSYVYPHFDSGLCAITVNIPEPKIFQFDELLTRVATMVSIDQAMENPLLKEKIGVHYPELRTSEIVVTDQLQHAIDVGGKYAETGLKWLGGIISGGVQKLGGYLEQKVEHTGQTNGSQTAQTKWTQFKEGTTKFFKVSSEYVSAVLDPVIVKGKEVVGHIGEKIDNSDNKGVKYLKEVGSTTADAVRHAFNGVAHAATEVGTAVTTTTKQLWDKKYGEDGVRPPANPNPENVGSVPPLIPQPPGAEPKVDKIDDDLKEEIDMEKELLNKKADNQPGVAYPELPDHPADKPL